MHMVVKLGLKTMTKRGSDLPDPKQDGKKNMSVSNEQNYLAEAETIPTTDELGKVGPGSHVRLGFESGHKFWCRVIEVRQSGYVGVAVDNLGVPVKAGDQCFFDRGNVFGIM